MKKLLFISLLLSITFVLFAQNNSSQYEEIEAESDGMLLTYYFFRTEEQLDNNINDIIQKITTIRYTTFKPNINLMKKHMVSIEYVEKNYPKFYKLYKNQVADDSSSFRHKDYEYALFGRAIDTNNGLLFLFRKVNGKVYFSISIYLLGGGLWYYTDQTLSLLETSL